MGSLSWRGGVKKPCALMRGDSRVVAVAIVETRYAVPGWGVGELWRRDDVVLAHEFRFGSQHGSDTWRRRRRPRRSTTSWSSAFARSSPGRRSVLRGRRRSTSSGRRRSSARSPTPCARCRAARSSRTASSPRSRVDPGAPRAAGAAVRREPLRVPRPVPSRRRRARDRRLRLRGRRRQAAAARARGSVAVITSEDVREELATIAPERECDRLAELSALFHSAGSLHLRGAGDWALHLDLGSGAAARRAFALLRDERDPLRDPDVPAPRVRHGDALPAPRRGRRETPSRVLVAAGVVDRRHGPLERPPRRVVARSCCRAAYLRGAFLGGGSLSLGRSPHLELRTASTESAALLARARDSGGRRARGRRARDSRRRLREELGGDRVAARARGRGRDRARARGARGRRRDERAREPARERRPREPRAHEPVRAASARGGRELRADVELAALPDRCARPPSSGSATRRSRCASSRRAPTHRARRPRCTGACARSRSSRG